MTYSMKLICLICVWLLCVLPSPMNHRSLVYRLWPTSSTHRPRRSLSAFPSTHPSSPSSLSLHSSPPTIFLMFALSSPPPHHPPPRPQSVPSICSLFPFRTISCPLCLSPHSFPPPTFFQEATFIFGLVVCICHVRAFAIS